MQKTRLGISVGLLGAAIYFMGLFSGYLLAVLLAGYVLLFEENSWLRKNAVKAMSVMAVFSLLITVLNLVPNAIGFINGMLKTTALSASLRAMLRRKLSAQNLAQRK